MSDYVFAKSVRPLAEEYVKAHLPDEYPFFSVIWTELIQTLSTAAAPRSSKDAAAWLSAFSPTFAQSRSINLMTPAVILVLEATARELGAKLVVPEESQVLQAISKCAEAFGVQKERARQMAQALCEPLRLSIKAIMQKCAPVCPEDMVGEQSFLTWKNSPAGIGISSKSISQKDVQRLLSSRNDYEIFIYDHTVSVRQKLSQHMQLNIDGVIYNLLLIFLRYKDRDISTRDIYSTAWRTPDGVAPLWPAGRAEKDVAADFLRTPICRLRNQIKVNIKCFEIENIRTVGYRCQGQFTFFIILPMLAEPRYRINSMC